MENIQRYKILLSIICTLFIGLDLTAQIKEIQLIESNFKVRNTSSQEFYFGLAEGDIITFTAKSNGSSIRSFKFMKYPGATIFGEGNMSSVIDKIIQIDQTGIYYFRFAQRGFLAGGRYCFLNASRKPGNKNTVDFNSTVYWNEKIDTVWYEEDEKFLIRTDTIVTHITNQVIELKKKKKKNDSRSIVVFSLPKVFNEWVIWIATGKSDPMENISSSKNGEKKDYLVEKYGELGRLALGGGSSFVSGSGCLPISYWMLSNQEAQQSFYGDSTQFLANKKLTCLEYTTGSDTLQEKMFIGLYNENKKNITVYVKIASVAIKEKWGTRKVRKFRINTTQIPYLKN
ncbi:MAG: hypothetical protein JKX68_12365 [Flavobacteriales bacterium]|nr:hypothetical protein [Flavobacteriales bacterium]